MRVESARRHWSCRTIQMVGLMLLFALPGAACSSDGDDVVQSGDAWQLQGALLAWDGEVWIVDDQPVVVPASLGVDDERILGATVDAVGTIDASGRRVAEDVDISEGEWPDSTLSDVTLEGSVGKVSTSSWDLDGREVIVPDGVRVHGADGLDGIADGDTVVVEGYELDDGRIVAVDVHRETDSGDADPGASQPQDGRTPFDPTVYSTPIPDDDDSDDKTTKPEKPEKPEHDDDTNHEKQKEKDKKKDRD